jgi:hypothetical protein
MVDWIVDQIREHVGSKFILTATVSGGVSTVDPQQISPLYATTCLAKRGVFDVGVKHLSSRRLLRYSGKLFYGKTAYTTSHQQLLHQISNIHTPSQPVLPA